MLCNDIFYSSRVFISGSPCSSFYLLQRDKSKMMPLSVKQGMVLDKKVRIAIIIRKVFHVGNFIN